MNRKRVSVLYLLFLILTALVFYSCESANDLEDRFSFLVRFKNDSVTYYSDDLIIKDFPVIQKSQLPHMLVSGISFFNNDLSTRFLNTSSCQSYLGWLLIDRNESKFETKIIKVGYNDDLFHDYDTNAQFYIFNIEDIGDVCDDTVLVSVNNKYNLTVIPSQCRVSPLVRQFILSDFGVPVTSNITFGGSNFSDTWYGIIYEVKANTYGINFLEPNSSSGSFFQGPLIDTLKFRFFGLKF